MFDLECPSCGRVGTIPRDKANSRLVCKKCNAVFHMSPSGRAIPGEPPLPSDKTQAPKPAAVAPAVAESWEKPGVSLALPSLRLKPLPILLAILAAVAVALGYSFISTIEPEPLGKKAQLAADALSAGNIETIKTLVPRENEGDVANWYGSVKELIDAARGGNPARKIIATAIVTEQNVSTGVGQTLMFFTTTGTDAKSAKPAGASPNKVQQLSLKWNLSGRLWRISGDSLTSAPHASTR
jgi:hypothetical protein